MFAVIFLPADQVVCAREISPRLKQARIAASAGKLLLCMCMVQLAKVVSRCQTLVASPLHTVSDNGLATRVWQRETIAKAQGIFGAVTCTA